MYEDLIFAMDIGTRTVVGIVGKHDGVKFKILASEVEAHKERAMYDGQVHDVELVAKAVKRVKEKLEKKLKIKLSKVSIAAAGRALTTCKSFVEREIDSALEIDKEMVSTLEIEGIQQAQKDMEQIQKDEEIIYYCAGYAVVNYYLNDGVIGNLVGQKGKKVGIEILATFLPRVVVDGLYAVVAKADLEVASLTLEPIAAMNVSIQNNLRLLNIALVDIGAGTSDIALTKNGTVFAFAMVPIAGDETTEKLAEQYLLDFQTAEWVKVNLIKKDTQKFIDIMGMEQEVATIDILETLKPTIKNLAEEITNKILEYNGKAPSAVFLVGGGSQIPMLPAYIAQLLELPVERVGIRNTSIIKDIEMKGKKLSGPEFITPIGIGVTAHMNRQQDFIHVSVNEKLVKLFNSKALTIADVLAVIRFNPRNLIGHRGNSLKFKLNGKDELQRGDPGEAAKIFVNGSKASLDYIIANGDSILIESATEGANAKILVKDYLGSSRVIPLLINGEKCEVKPIIKINSKMADIEDEIKENDEVILQNVRDLGTLLKVLDLDFNAYDFRINGTIAHQDFKLRDGDEINFIASHTSISKYQEINVVINDNNVVMKEYKSEIILVDVFNYINFDYKNIKGRLILTLNGLNANFTDVLKDGDILVVRND